MLRQLGHKVSGLALEPVDGGLFSLANLESEMESHVIADIRDFEAVKKAMQEARPDFAIHMAAQPLVLRSYEDPIETYTTNVDGTLNFLRAITEMEKHPVSLVITTDKVYRDSYERPYIESDALGGYDPYSASKAMSDILTQSWMTSYPELRLFIARAGNVIGSFDVSEDRLIPDILRAHRSGQELEIRNADATRPWQHVFDCLSGYLKLLERAPNGPQFERIYNFGPNIESFRTVADVVSTASQFLPSLHHVQVSSKTQARETQLLALDSSRAQKLLGWRSLISFELAIQLSLEDHSTSDVRKVAMTQLVEFLSLRKTTESSLGDESTSETTI